MLSDIVGKKFDTGSVRVQKDDFFKVAAQSMVKKNNCKDNN